MMYVSIHSDLLQFMAECRKISVDELEYLDTKFIEQDAGYYINKLEAKIQSLKS